MVIEVVEVFTICTAAAAVLSVPVQSNEVVAVHAVMLATTADPAVSATFPWTMRGEVCAVLLHVVVVPQVAAVSMLSTVKLRPVRLMSVGVTTACVAVVTDAAPVGVPGDVQAVPGTTFQPYIYREMLFARLLMPNVVAGEPAVVCVNEKKAHDVPDAVDADRALPPMDT